MVGCVIVHNQQIIGEGYHRQFGGAHAEVEAVKSVRDLSLLAESTLYVNLEPCSHHGKTPPCTDLIIGCRIPEIFISVMDPYPKVAGDGCRRLESAGVKVNMGLLDKESLFLNRRFMVFNTEKRPYIILKWAQTPDGYIGMEGISKEQVREQWISSMRTNMLVHKWRSEEDAIMTGTNTAIVDDPQLNVRHWVGRNPVRILIDRNLRVGHTARIFQQGQPTLLFNLKEQKIAADVEYIKMTDDTLGSILKTLTGRNIQSVIVEGGARLINSFIREGLWDEARVISGRRNFGKGIPAPVLHMAPREEHGLHGDVIRIYYRQPFWL
jgi:diaminohydroxyphosphoribosylaminopyrimidine deaminase/5-amino-6-(5-phosphoribosylamino)uracil reductase